MFFPESSDSWRRACGSPLILGGGLSRRLVVIYTRSSGARGISYATSIQARTACARVRPKKQFGAEMDVDAGKLPRPQTTTIHRLSFYGTVTIRQRARPTLPGRRRTCHGTVSAALQLLLVQQSLWEPRFWGGDTTRPPRTGSRRIRVASELRSVAWLILGSKLERVGAPRRMLEMQRYRSSGRHDITGCLRPCLIAYYDFCLLGTDSRMATGFFECCGLGVLEALSVLRVKTC